MKVALFNRNGLEMVSQTFPIGTLLCQAARTLFHRHFGKVVPPMMVAGRDYLGECVSINEGSYKAREVK